MASTSLTASLRLNISANTGPLASAMKSLRGLKNEALSLAKNTRANLGPSPISQQIFGPSKGAFQLAAHIGQATSAMAQFKGQLDSAVGEPIKKFADFELMLARVKGRTDGITTEGFGRLKAAAEAAGSSTTFTAAEAAEGLFELAGAGLDVNQQIGALRPVLRLAQASQLGLGQASAIATNTMAQFGLTVGDIPSISDTLNAAANASTIELAELGDTMRYVGPIANASGLSLKTTATFAALLGNAGIAGTQAGTALRGMLASLANVTPRSAKALKSVGLSSKEAAAGLKDPISFLQKLNTQFKAKGFDEAQRLSVLVRVFGREVAPATAALLDAGSKLDAQGQTSFDKMTEAMSKAEGSTERFASAVENTTAGKLKLFESQMDGIKLQLGEAFVPALQELTKSMGPVLADFSQWIKENPRLVANIGKLAIGVGAVLGPLTAIGFAASSAATAIGLFRVPLQGALLPLRLTGAGLAAVRTRLLATGTAAGSFGAAMTGAVGVVGAAFAGWEVGKILDDTIGKMFQLRGMKLSTELGLSAGESNGFNEAVLGFAETFGIDSLKEAAKGNIAANTVERATQRGSGITTKPAPGAAPGQPPLAVENRVIIEDKRTRVQSNVAGKRTEMRTGSNL